MSDVDVSELNRLAVDLDEWAGPATRVQVARALDKTSVDITTTAQTFVPVDTGATKSSIGWERVDQLAREIGPTTEYAPYLEMGTSVMAPYAFMGPALDRHAPDLVDAIEEIVEQVLR